MRTKSQLAGSLRWLLGLDANTPAVSENRWCALTLTAVRDLIATWSPDLNGPFACGRDRGRLTGASALRCLSFQVRHAHTLHPRDCRVFAGVIDLDHWPTWGRLLFKALGGHAGDNRHWPDIDAWAEQIARAVRALE
jgi:hypothetical protein